MERRFRNVLAVGRHRLPDVAQRAINEPRCITDFFYNPNICVSADGSVHDTSTQAVRDAETRREFVSRGYRVIIIRYDRDIAEQMTQHSHNLGRPV